MPIDIESEYKILLKGTSPPWSGTRYSNLLVIFISVSCRREVRRDEIVCISCDYDESTGDLLYLERPLQVQTRKTPKSCFFVPSHWISQLWLTKKNKNQPKIRMILTPSLYCMTCSMPITWN